MARQARGALKGAQDDPEQDATANAHTAPVTMARPPTSSKNAALMNAQLLTGAARNSQLDPTERAAGSTPPPGTGKPGGAARRRLVHPARHRQFREASYRSCHVTGMKKFLNAKTAT
jgi:hypothetical protein